MGLVLRYMVETAIVMTLLYLAYKPLMAPTAFHRLNRCAILFIYLASWTIPALARLSLPHGATTVAAGVPAMVFATDYGNPGEGGTDWWNIALWVYAAGAAATAAGTMAGVWRMVRIIRSGHCSTQGSYTEIVSPLAPGPFSWGRYIVVRPSDCDRWLPMVTNHEKTHLRLYHWLDLVPVQLSLIFQWFSPAAWLLRNELKKVHEFQVDKIAAGDHPAEYQFMLLRKTAGSSFPTFADSLNHSHIKTRITMMGKKSNSSRRIAALVLPAMAALSLSVLSQPAVAGVLGQMSQTADNTVSNSKINQKQTTAQATRQTADMKEAAAGSETRPKYAVEKIAEFKGGAEAMNKFFADNVKYPVTAIKSGKSGRVVVQFVINTDGSVSDTKVLRSIHKDLDEEALRVVRLSSGLWTPARNNGKPVKSQYVIPVSFKVK